jgi:site-specific recombinase
VSNDQLRELNHLFITTRSGGWSHRTPRKVPQSLVKLGYADAADGELYRVTAAGVAALQNADTPYPVATVYVWCDQCNAPTVHHCLYDHATGERFACAGCANVEETAS